MANSKAKIRTFAFIVIVVFGGIFVMSTSAENNRAQQRFTNETVSLTSTYQELDGAELQNIEATADTFARNESTNTTYQRGTDYEIDEQNVSIRRNTSGAIASGEKVQVDYTVEYFPERQSWGVASAQTLWGIVALLVLVGAAAFLLSSVSALMPGRNGGGGRI
jgi:hypothetical protein